MPSKRKRSNKEISTETVQLKPDFNYYNFPGRLINWLETPENFKNFQNYLVIQTVACSIFYSWYQYQFEQAYE